jgi:hypothetical protein
VGLTVAVHSFNIDHHRQTSEKGTDFFSLICPFFYVVPSVFSIFLLQDVMRSDPAKEHPSRLKLKSASVVHSHRTLFAVFSLDSLD